ncbi:cation-translocating P-type ATPase [Marinobacter salicampi]|uniref:cation-translocating P-type ATPase n=1 Tax=Marinobacter salicampi TaxID=435907 RepID=UPI00140B7885|nr:cation-transporting P-type ATPase [Marinobacter salicampi]
MSEDKSDQQRTPWHSLSADDALEKLNSSDQGLSDKQAADLLKEHGPNELQAEEGRPWWLRLLDQFNNVLIIILLIAGVTAGAMGRWVDAGAIFAVVIINAAIGFFQEAKAEKALQSIKGMLSPEATVKRDGKKQTVPAEDLVPGDIVLLESGDRVPADIRLLSAKQFRTEEAPLTGESEPVDKSTDPVEEDADLGDRTSMAFASTLCVHGSCEGLVVATAMDTEIGHISEMIENVEQMQAPLQKQLDHFGKVLAAGILAVAAAMGAFGVLVHGRGLEDMFMAGVGLAVAAIPQGLPAIVTVTLALGVQAMAKRNAIVRQLAAVETLGSVSTIFTDKTGTLTRNEMTVSAIAMAGLNVEVSGTGFDPEGELTRDDKDDDSSDPTDSEALQRFLVAGVLCNDSQLKEEDGAWTVEGDPTEGALLVLADKAGEGSDDIRESYRRVDVIPFESERKYMATLDEPKNDGDRVVHLKGAPDVLLDMCDKADSDDGEQDIDKDYWNSRIEELSSRGLRVLALARRAAGQGDTLDENEVEQGLVLLGLVGMLDPARESAVDSVKECLDAGIQVKMVTGDHALTAKAIGDQMGLGEGGEAMTGQDIEDTSDEDLRDRVMEVNVFARAAPEHKLRLVEAIQSRDQVCAMTGDGVNDAPALKRADIGVAMGIQGSEASKEAAEMVLADDNFASIVNAVEEGRRIYDNIRKTITFLLPTNGAESLAILIAVLGGTLLPITPVQILWVNMVTAVTLGLSLAFEPAEDDIMRRPPRDPHEPILNLFLLWRVVFVAVLLVAPVYGLFMWLQAQGASEELSRSAAVNMLVVGEIVYLLNTRRSLTNALSFKGLFGSRLVLMAIGLVVVLQLAWTYLGPMQYLFESASLTLTHWGLIWAAGITIFLLIELEKLFWRRKQSHD